MTFCEKSVVKDILHNVLSFIQRQYSHIKGLFDEFELFISNNK